MKKSEDIIIRPYITEKSNLEVTQGKYTFVVAKKATKVEIFKAVEELFNVKVKSVNIQNHQGKEKRQGVHVGRTAAWKKAIVTIDTQPEAETYMTKKGQSVQENRKYKNSIEEFGFLQ